MSSARILFDQTLSNLKVTNAEVIAKRRQEITKALNRHFRDSESEESNCLMVGSYGRHTAINGVSDLDMLYILPDSIREDYNKEAGPYKALKATKDAIAGHYSRTKTQVDRLVVVVDFNDFKFEVQPVFENADGSFDYPDTVADTWKTTKPRAEIDEMRRANELTDGNARTICRLARAWKRKHEVPMNGLLIDSLAVRFLNESKDYDTRATKPDYMMRDFFAFLAELPRQPTFAALGSNQRIKVKQNFQAKAKRAMELSDKAIDAVDEGATAKKWRRVFGRFVPLPNDGRAASKEEYRDTEEFIEDYYTVGIEYTLQIECKVTQNGFRPYSLRQMLKDKIFLRPNKKLDFWIDHTNTPEPYAVRWKVLNRGHVARQRDAIRGQIIKGKGARTHVEHTVFSGEHYVECYLIKDNTVVAKDHLEVPISTHDR